MTSDGSMLPAAARREGFISRFTSRFGFRRRFDRGLAVPLCSIGAGALIFLASRTVQATPEFVEMVFVRGWAAHIMPPLSRAFGIVPFPVVEILVLGYLTLRIWHLSRGGWNLARGNRTWTKAARSVAHISLRDIGLAVVIFYGFWGFHYARAPAMERLDLPSVESIEAEEALALARELIEVSNASYVELHGTADAGTPTRMPEKWDALNASLGTGWARTAAILPAGPLVTADFGPAKSMLLSPLVAYLGITGIYSPFTAEPLVVGTTPAVSLGLSLAHEQAHQRGITDEGEATLMGFVAAMESGHPLLRYSAATRAQSRLLSLVRRQDREMARELMALRLPGVSRDLRDLRDFARSHRGASSRVTTRVNDVYLRANRVPGGVRSYDSVTEMLVRYARARGGTFDPDFEGGSEAAEGSRVAG